MSSPKSSTLSFPGPPAAAFEAVMSALPKDAVVREEEDGVGRFAGERTVALTGRGNRKIMLLEGTWSGLKKRIEEPMVLVEFAAGEGGSGTEVTLTIEPTEAASGAGAMVMGLLVNALTVGAVAFAYYTWRGQGVDTTRVAIIAGGGGLAWSLITKFMPSGEEESLEAMVRTALETQEDEDEDEDTA